MWISIVANWFSSIKAARNVVDWGQWRQVVSPVIQRKKPTTFLAVSARSFTWANVKCLCASFISLLSFHPFRLRMSWVSLSLSLSWPQAWANVSGPSVIGTLGPKWQRATCLPAHFLGLAHTLGLANAMPAHTLVQYDAHKHIQTQKCCRRCTVHTQTLKSTFTCYKSRGQHDWTSCPLCAAFHRCTEFQDVNSINKYCKSRDHVNVKNKSWFWISILDPVYSTFFLAGVWITECLPIWLGLVIQVSLFATDLALATTEQKVWRA